MSEKQHSSESQEATAAARFLIDRMKAGDRLNPGMFNELIDVLKTYQSGGYEPSIKKPIPPPATRAVRSAPPSPPLVSRSTVREASHSRTESFLEKEPWNQFNNEIFRFELSNLSEEERSLVARGAEIIAEETIACRAVETKAIGAQVPQYSHDYATMDVRSPTDPAFTWEGWETYFNQAFSLERLLIEKGSEEKNMIFATTAHALGERGLAFLAVHFQTTGDATTVDNRPIRHEYRFFVKNGKIMNFLRTGKALRLIPFMIQCAVIKMNPERVVFVDGSMAGYKGLFGRAKNPFISVVQDEERGFIFEDEDTRTEHPSRQWYTGTSSNNFLATAQNVRGPIDSNYAKRLIGFRSRGRFRILDLPRVNKGDVGIRDYQLTRK